MEIPSFTEFPFRHSMAVQLRYSDVDMQGHVNNSIYFQLMDLAKVEYFAAAKGAPLTADDGALVAANININFLEPTLPGEKLEVQTQTMAIGTKSLRLCQRVINSATGTVKCEALTVMVSPHPITAEWLTALSRFEQRSLLRG